MGNFPVSYALSPGFNLHQSNVKVVQQLLTVTQVGFFTSGSWKRKEMASEIGLEMNPEVFLRLHLQLAQCRSTMSSGTSV